MTELEELISRRPFWRQNRNAILKAIRERGVGPGGADDPDLLADIVMQMALSGNVDAIAELCDLAEGPVPEQDDDAG